uniref:Secreted protein n=1 Tax=Plectus sambesii TaxID=2011161 RepID=A0A914USQ9_9BILA
MYGLVVLVALYATALAGPFGSVAAIEDDAQNVDGMTYILETQISDRTDVPEGFLQETHDRHHDLEEQNMNNEKDHLTLDDFISGRLKESDDTGNRLGKTVEGQEEQIKDYYDGIVITGGSDRDEVTLETDHDISKGAKQEQEDTQFFLNAVPESEDAYVSVIVTAETPTELIEEYEVAAPEKEID